jgi:hypothetical protein
MAAIFQLANSRPARATSETSDRRNSASAQAEPAVAPQIVALETMVSCQLPTRDSPRCGCEHAAASCGASRAHRCRALRSSPPQPEPRFRSARFSRLLLSTWPPRNTLTGNLLAGPHRIFRPAVVAHLTATLGNSGRRRYHIADAPPGGATERGDSQHDRNSPLKRWHGRLTSRPGATPGYPMDITWDQHLASDQYLATTGPPNL